MGFVVKSITKAEYKSTVPLLTWGWPICCQCILQGKCMAIVNWFRIIENICRNHIAIARNRERWPLTRCWRLTKSPQAKASQRMWGSIAVKIGLSFILYSSTIGFMFYYMYPGFSELDEVQHRSVCTWHPWLCHFPVPYLASYPQPDMTTLPNLVLDSFSSSFIVVLCQALRATEPAETVRDKEK